MKRRRELVVLLVLLAVFAAVAWYQWNQITTQQRVAAAVTGPARARRAGEAAGHTGVPAVRLDALAQARSTAPPSPPERNLFQFEAKALPPPPKPLPGQPGADAGIAGDPAVPPPPPPPPPIQLKFIGIVQSPKQKLAVLTDPSTRDVFYGREGDIVDGRFRILRIGVESIEMAYVDGRGRQSIRLSGS